MLHEPPAALSPEDEPRQLPPGGNDPSPHGSLEVKGRVGLEGGSEQICRREIESWNLFWSVFYGLVGVGVSKRWNRNIFRFPLQIQSEQNNKRHAGASPCDPLPD